MRILTKLAGGAVLGSAALLLAAPAAALAATDGPSDEPTKTSDQGRESKEKSDHDSKTFNLKDKDGNGVTCVSNKQVNEQNINQIIKDNTIKHSVVTFNITLSAAQSATNTATANGGNNTVVCIRDIDVDVDVRHEMLSDLLSMVEASRGQAAAPAGNAPAPGGAYAGPDGAWVLPGKAGVATGDGGSLDTNTGALAAAGAGMIGVGALGGIALLRRRSANDTAA